jgi:hypothetical protein
MVTRSRNLTFHRATRAIPQVHNPPLHAKRLSILHLQHSAAHYCSPKCNTIRGFAAGTGAIEYPVPDGHQLLPFNLIHQLLSIEKTLQLANSHRLDIHLLWLFLRCSTSDIFAHIGDINKLSSSSLCGLPALSNGWWHALVLDLRVDHG